MVVVWCGGYISVLPACLTSVLYDLDSVRLAQTINGHVYNLENLEMSGILQLVVCTN